MDLMRLPLGILTGVGFIGGGAILHRRDLITGVTTAATLWVVTVIGLCLGGGQTILGIAATVLALSVLWGLKWCDQHMPREQRATLVIATDGQPGAFPEIAGILAPLGYRARFDALNRSADGQYLRLTFEIHWTKRADAGSPTELIARLEREKSYRVEKFELMVETG
jgi:putative Mg2+ transporter-C (MgtC) family protein